MSVSLSALSVRGILLDIEGTTTPMGFVYEVLFPFARAHVKQYLEKHIDSEELSPTLETLRQEYREDGATHREVPHWRDDPPDARIDSIVTYVHWLMDRDRKSAGLKSLQGKIWQEGYASGQLQGQVFPDVPPALQRWHRSHIDVRIFSSGSVLAQKLLFSTTPAGDLTKFLRGYFDTTTGPKNDESSYKRIAEGFALPASSILFISDVTTELDAASSAGMQALLCVRPGTPPQTSQYRITRSFHQIF